MRVGTATVLIGVEVVVLIVKCICEWVRIKGEGGEGGEGVRE